MVTVSRAERQFGSSLPAMAMAPRSVFAHLGTCPPEKPAATQDLDIVEFDALSGNIRAHKAPDLFGDIGHAWCSSMRTSHNEVGQAHLDDSIRLHPAV